MGSIGAQQISFSNALGLSNYESMGEYANASRENREIMQELESLKVERDRLNKELDKERIEDDDPEIKALGRSLASMFDKYTERGEEIRKEIKALRERETELEATLQANALLMNKLDDKAYQEQIVTWRNNMPKLVPITQKEYKGFSTSTDNIASSIHNAVKSGDAVIVEMSPKEYLQRISYDVFGASLERGVRGVVTDNVKKYAKQMKQGVKFDLPWIDLKHKGQEGRHRAMAAILNGYDKIPVAVRIR